MLGDIAAFDDDLVTDQDRRGDRQVEGKVVVGLVFGLWFCSNFDGNWIFFPQPGDNLLEVFSRLAVWFVEKKADLQHGCLLGSIRG